MTRFFGLGGASNTLAQKSAKCVLRREGSVNYLRRQIEIIRRGI